jgi:uncharacterized protein YndB with AHSA1/START domain
MQRVTVERELPWSVDRAFAHLSEHENLGALFGTRSERVRDGADGHRNGVGSARRMSLHGLLPFTETVTEFVPGERIAYAITEGGVIRDHRGEMSFTATAGGGTLVRCDIVFRGRVPGLGLLVKPSLVRSIRRELDRLAATP